MYLIKYVLIKWRIYNYIRFSPWRKQSICKLNIKNEKGDLKL